MLLATANPLIYLFYTEILVFSRLNQGWRGGGENFSSCAYSVTKSKQLKGYYYEIRAAYSSWSVISFILSGTFFVDTTASQWLNLK